MLYNRCLQFIISLLELLSRTGLHSFNANYLILSISTTGFIFHSYLLGKFINSVVCLMKLLVVGLVIWMFFFSRPGQKGGGM